MEINSAQLLAQAAYTKVKQQPQVQDNSFNDAVSFQKMVNVEFNRFAKMTPDQILSHIKNVQSTSKHDLQETKNFSSGFVPSAIGAVKNKIDSNEHMIKKSLIGEASALDLTNASVEAKQTVQTLVTLNKAFIESFEKILNINI